MPMSEKRKQFLIKEISKLHRKGWPNSKISSELDCSAAFISKYTKKEDIEFKAGLQADDIIERLTRFLELKKQGVVLKVARKQCRLDEETRKKYQMIYDKGGRQAVVDAVMNSYNKSKKPNHERQAGGVDVEYMEHVTLWNHLLYNRPLESHAA